MSATDRSPWSSYVIAVVGGLLAGSSHWWFDLVIGGTPPMRLLLVLVVTVSAWRGGLGPGLFATALGLIVIVAANDAPGNWSALSTRLYRFGALSLLISFLCGKLYANRRRAEAREQEYLHSEGRFRRLVEIASEGIWVVDRAGRTIYANSRLGEILGAASDRLIGRLLEEFFAKDHVLPLTWPLDLDGPLPALHEVRLRCDSGLVRDALVTARPIGPDEVPRVGPGPPRGGDGGLLLMVTDITALKQAEAALRAERDFSSAVLETAGSLVVVLDQEGRVVRFNRACRQVTGYAAEEVIGSPFWDLFLAPEEAGPVRAGFDKLLAGTGLSRFENYWTTVKGDRRLISWSSATLTDAEGRVTFVIGTGTDVTELRLAEESLREKVSVLRSFYESSAMAMGVVELTGDDTRFVSANALTDQFFGLLPGELEGMTARALGAPPDRLKTWVARFRECRETGRPVRFEYESIWPTSPKWVAATLSAMAPHGPGLGLCSFIVEDITDRKRTEAELRDAKEAAEAANRAKDQFLAVLSHELRTPLTPVLLAVSSILETSADASFRPVLEMIRRNIALEARLIDDLLDLSRIARGRILLDLEVLDLHQAVRRAVEICREEARAAGLRVVTELKARHHHVTADHARLMQVIWNLIRNAAKFTEPGGRLTIRTSNPAEIPALAGSAGRDNPPLLVEFEDTGIGIDPAFLPKIFEPFEQGQDDLRGRRGGLGLGLAIGRSLAEAIGGRLTATSPGRGLGSTFSLELKTTPASAPALLGSKGDGHVTAGSPPDNRDRTSLRILLVEDNRDTLRYLQAVLRQRGHDVVATDRLVTARAAFDEAGLPFDLLISDIELPDGNGLDLMRELNEVRTVAGIAMSGFGAEDDLQQSREAGFFDHLTKPIDLNRLVSAIFRATTQQPVPVGKPDRTATVALPGEPVDEVDV